MARTERIPVTLTVRSTSRVAPHLVRVVAGGEEFDQLNQNDFTDRYVKLLFTDADGDTVRRTYTVRSWDVAARELVLDFVTHGTEGIAAPWAAAAQPGDTVTMVGAGGAYSPDPDADWHLLVGDDSALPAISAAVEALAADARGHLVVEVDGTADELLPQVPAGVQVHWLHRDGAVPGEVSLLPAAIRALDWPEGRVHVFAHGEREAMKALRDVVFGERGLERSQVSLSGYWAHGRTEDRFQAEKREPIGQIL